MKRFRLLSPARFARRGQQVGDGVNGARKRGGPPIPSPNSPFKKVALRRASFRLFHRVHRHLITLVRNGHPEHLACHGAALLLLSGIARLREKSPGLVPGCVELVSVRVDQVASPAKLVTASELAFDEGNRRHNEAEAIQRRADHWDSESG